MAMLRCVLAEWRIARARLLRTRLGVWLGAIAVGLAALAAHPWGPEPRGAAIGAAMLGATLAVAFTVGSDVDRAALALVLTHPTHAGTVVVGRWLAATGLGAAAGAATALAAALLRQAVAVAAPAAAVAVVAGAAAAGGAVAAAFLGGNALLAVLFLYMALLGGTPPDAMAVDRWAPAGDVAAALARALPAPWRYEHLARGDAPAWAHAAAWIVGGPLLAAARVAFGARR